MLGVVTVRSAARRSIDAEIPVQHGRARVLSGLRASNTGLLLLSLTVGAGAGGGAIAFRWLITAFTRRLSGHADYSAAGHTANPLVPGLGRWFMLLAPVAAGLVYGPLVHFFAREARGHGVPEVMYAVARRGGRIAPQVAVVKALASALCDGVVRRRRRLGRPGRPDRADRFRAVLDRADRARRPNPGCGCSWRAGRPAASRPPSTPRWPGCSSRWNSSCATSPPSPSAWWSSRQ